MKFMQDIIHLIIDRFMSLENINVVDFNSKTIDCCHTMFTILNCKKHIRERGCFICDIHFKSDVIDVIYTDNTGSTHGIFVSYDDFVDVDMFVGNILSKKYYG